MTMGCRNRLLACSDRRRVRVWPAQEMPAAARAARPWRPRAGAGGHRAPVRVGGALTGQQVAAIAAIVRLFVADDLANGVSPSRALYCGACRRNCPAPGFVRYGGHEVCNPCAIDFELRRARGLVRTIAEYLAERHARPST